MMLTESITAEMEACKIACIECQATCIETLNYCKTQSHTEQNITLMSMMRDCAEMCMMCVNMIVDGSEFMRRTCELCAEMCDRYAITCELLSNDAQMMAAAVVCRKCAESCKAVAMNSASSFRRPTSLTASDITC